ncbi:MAG: fluoride efflux transporter CrcB [Elusimicrobia bacterium]|nr:fluoride efflux transporter CrcB [Elusimicrobiota bacterium]
MKWFSLCMGSVVGGVSRYALAGLVYKSFGSNFPYGTLVVNLSGCFLIGFLNALAEVKFLLNPNARILLMVGFCGAFTTFSTLILETVNLLKDGELLKAILNGMGSFVLGLLLFYLGQIVAELV